MLDELRRRYSPIHDRRRRQEAAERRRFGVIVWSLARLGRDSVEATHIISDLRLRGLEVMSLSDDIVTGHTGLDQILEQLTFYKAQQDLTQLSRESKRGLHHVVSLRDTDPTFLAHNPGWEPTGRYLGVVPGNPPAGYRVERIVIGRRGGSKHEVQRLVPDPDTWERCRLAWQMRVERDATYREIHEATRLFSQNSVSNYGGLFRKRIYTGVYEFGGETYGSLPDDPFVEPLIPVAWFEQEAAAREARARARRKGGSRPPGLPDPRSSFGGRLLTGLVVCARCGSRMWTDKFDRRVIAATGQVRKEWPFYWCSGAKRGEGCDAGRVNAERLERAVVDNLRQTILSPERLRSRLHDLLAHLDERRLALATRLDVTRRDLARAERQADNLVDVLAERPESATLLRRLDQLEGEQADLRRQAEQMEAELALLGTDVMVDDRQLATLSERALRHLAGDDLRQARHALAAYVKEILVDPGKPIAVTVVYTVPYPAPGETSGPGSLRLELGAETVTVRRSGPPSK